MDMQNKINRMLGTGRTMRRQNPTKKGQFPPFTLGEGHTKIPKGWPKKVMFEGEEREVIPSMHIPTVLHPVSPYGPINDYKGKSVSNKFKGASIQKQQQWKNMSFENKTVQRILRVDTDKDGTPNRWDCQPLNRFRQDYIAYHGSPYAPKIKKEGFKMSGRGMVSFAPATPQGKKHSLLFTAPRDKLITEKEKREYNIKTKKPIYGLSEKTNPKNILTVRIKEDNNFATANDWNKAMKKQNLNWMNNESEKKKSQKEFQAIKSLKQQGYRGINFDNREYASFYVNDIEILDSEVKERQKEYMKEYHQKRKEQQELEGASEEKQQEWEEKNEIEKDIDRITKPDIDSDNIPDEYDDDNNEYDDENDNI